MVHFRHFLSVFPLMTAVLFCYFSTFLLKKGVQKRVPQNRLIIRKTHFMGGTLKNSGHILWFFTRDSWVGQGVSCPSQKSLFFRTNRTDIGSAKLALTLTAGSRRKFRAEFLEDTSERSARWCIWGDKFGKKNGIGHNSSESAQKALKTSPIERASNFASI